MTRRALVTGSAGFVGPHLTAALEAAGRDVWTTDRTPAPERAQHLPCDLTDADAVRGLVERVRPERVFHLASLSSVAYSFDHPLEVLQTNLAAACNVLEALRHAAPAARLLLVGSAEQYGQVAESELPLAESQPFRPASPYAVSKVAQEVLGMQYAAAHGLYVVACRSFNHSGPGQTDRFVLPAFARQIAAAEAGAGEPVLRVGNLDVWRDFLDVRDVVAAYVQILERGTAGQAYNVCSGTAHRIGDLLETMLAAARRPLHVEIDPARYRPADLRALRGDPAKLEGATGWRPRRTVPAMLHDILDDWRRRVA